MPNLYIIAGCNGAGKTTASYTILPEVLNCYEFINADEIAKGLSPFKPESVSFEAGRIMLHQIQKHLDAKIDFAIETTLSSKHYEGIIKEAKQKGYTINLLFFWLPTIESAKERVKKRVENGGHSIPPDIIERRYKRGLYNFFYVYNEFVNSWMLIDNSKTPPEIIAEKETTLICNNSELYNQIKNNSNHG
jgi:predicted ABC-type ATPase